LVFLDEMGARTDLTPRYGRAPKGERLYARAPQGHWKSTTFIAALRHDGLTAPMVTDGPLNGALFIRYVEQFLCPTLQPGDMIVMDNLAAHKVKGVTAAIEACGAKVLYLPPYSPEFNPIEQVFAKLKALLRQAEARTVTALWECLGQLLDCFSPQECRNYFRHSGYCAVN
jgi:transposase